MTAVVPGTPMDDPVIGIDLGGTKVASGVVTGAVIADRQEVPTPRGLENLLDLLQRLVEAHDAGARQRLRVGLGLPGPVRDGQSTFFSNLQELNDTRLESELARRLNRTVVIENDANLAALAEFHFGASRGTTTSAYLTWSTGIGCGLILHGHLHSGRHGMAGEVGHTRITPLGPMDGSGTVGTLEAQISGAALARDAGFVFGRAVPVPDLFGLAATDARARTLLQHAAAHLGIYLHNLQLLLDPDCVVLGGGLFQHLEVLLPMIEAARRQTGALDEFTPLVPSRLGRDAGIIGAALLARGGRSP